MLTANLELNSSFLCFSFYIQLDIVWPLFVRGLRQVYHPFSLRLHRYRSKTQYALYSDVLLENE